MHRPIILKTHLDTSGNAPCARCGELARWWEVEEDSAICSVCFFYEHPEGVELATEIEGFVKAVEEEKGQVFPKNEGRVLLADADNLLAILVLTTRVFLAEDQMMEERGS